jgi:hypothetical protein
MLPQSHLAVVARNVTWDGPALVATEPFECGWAREALVFVRLLKPPTWQGGPRHFEMQVGPDGLRWAAHGATVPMPADEAEMTCASLTRFGGWLRLAGQLAEGERLTALVSIHLKA